VVVVVVVVPLAVGVQVTWEEVEPPLLLVSVSVIVYVVPIVPNPQYLVVDSGEDIVPLGNWVRLGLEVTENVA
jgi:hypothetical protein